MRFGADSFMTGTSEFCLIKYCDLYVHQVRESFQKAAKNGRWEALEQFPFAEAVVCLGFFAVYFLEELAGLLMGHGKKSGHGDHHNKRAKSHAEEDEHKLSARSQPADSNGHAVIVTGSDLEESRSRSSSESTVVVQPDCSSIIHRREEEEGHHHGHSHGPVFSNLDQKSVSAAIRGFLLVFALSFHAIFEGMAIGLQPALKVDPILFLKLCMCEMSFANSEKNLVGT